MIPNDSRQYIEQRVAEGALPQEIALELGQRMAGWSPADMAEAAAYIADQYRARLRKRGIVVPANRVEDAANMAHLILRMRPRATYAEIGKSVLARYADLTVEEMAQVLRHGEPYSVFPQIAATDMVLTLQEQGLYPDTPKERLRLALQAARYTAQEIEQALGKRLEPPKNFRLADATFNTLLLAWDTMDEHDVVSMQLEVTDAAASPLPEQPRHYLHRSEGKLDISDLPPGRQFLVRLRGIYRVSEEAGGTKPGEWSPTIPFARPRVPGNLSYRPQAFPEGLRLFIEWESSGEGITSYALELLDEQNRTIVRSRMPMLNIRIEPSGLVEGATYQILVSGESGNIRGNPAQGFFTWYKP